MVWGRLKCEIFSITFTLDPFGLFIIKVCFNLKINENVFISLLICNGHESGSTTALFSNLFGDACSPSESLSSNTFLDLRFFFLFSGGWFVESDSSADVSCAKLAASRAFKYPSVKNKDKYEASN